MLTVNHPNGIIGVGKNYVCDVPFGYSPGKIYAFPFLVTKTSGYGHASVTLLVHNNQIQIYNESELQAEYKTIATTVMYMI